MTLAMSTIDSMAITPAWRSLQQALPVRLAPVRNEPQYQALHDLLNHLVDVVGDDEEHELVDLLDLVGQLITDYEDQHYSLPDAPPWEVLRFLMEQHGLKQSDLTQEVGEEAMSDILNGKREINIRQAKALGERFGVSPMVFI